MSFHVPHDSCVLQLMKREGDYIKHPPPTLYNVESFSFVNIHSLVYSLSYSLWLYSLTHTQFISIPLHRIHLLILYTKSWGSGTCLIPNRQEEYFAKRNFSTCSNKRNCHINNSSFNFYRYATTPSLPSNTWTLCISHLWCNSRYLRKRKTIPSSILNQVV